jgi:hypothetical protein
MIFLESPWPVLFIGILVEAVLAVMLLRSGRGYLLWIMIGVAALVAVGLLVERFVVTDRKSVEQTLYSGVAAAEANDLNRLLDCISPTAAQTRSDARWMLERVEVRSAYVRNLEITINHLMNPATAQAKFQVIGQGQDRRAEFPYGTFSRAVTVHLRLEGKRWLVTGYDVEGLNLQNLRSGGRELP